MSALIDAVRNLAATRQSKADIDAQVKASRAVWELDNAELLSAQKMVAQRESSEAAQVKALAEVAYRETQSTHLAPGVQIKLYATIAYKESDALAWAQQSKMALVPESLDVRAFERIAKAAALPFVTYTNEPRAQIASDLAAAVAEVAEVVR